MTWAIVGLYGLDITIDVSSDNDLWGGYDYQEEYTLERDVFLMLLRYDENRLTLVPKRPSQDTSYKGVIRKGTRLQTYKLERHFVYSLFIGGYGTGLIPYVKILDGEFAGTIVSIEDISIFYKEDGIFKYRPEELLISRSTP